MTKKPAQAVSLTVALSDDIKKIGDRWDAVVGKLPAKYSYLKMALLDGAKPSVTPDGKTLLVVFTDFVSASMLMGDRGKDNREFFEAFLEEQTGVHVHVEYKQLDNAGQVSENHVDIRDIKKIENSGKIQMPIEIE